MFVRPTQTETGRWIYHRGQSVRRLNEDTLCEQEVVVGKIMIKQNERQLLTKFSVSECR